MFRKITKEELYRAKEEAGKLERIYYEASDPIKAGSAKELVDYEIKRKKAAKESFAADKIYDKLWLRYRKQNGLR